MSNEFKAEGASGRVVKNFLISPEGKWWNGSAFETYLSANVASYLLAQTEQGVSGLYFGNFPTAITTAGIYVFFSYYADPYAEGDPSISSGTVDWNGSASVGPDGDISSALLTLNEAKQFLKITAATEDAIVIALTVAASKMIERYCDRSFISSQKTEYYHGNNERSLILRSYPVTDVASLYIDSTRQWGSGSAVSVGNDAIVETSGLISLWNNQYSFTRGFYNVKVTYTSGYAFESLPADLKMACRIVLLYLYKRMYQDQRIGITSETIGDRNMTYANEDIPKTAKLLLKSYVNRGPSPYVC